MNLIYLIGMPGSGKSYWGSIWGDKYGYEVVDLDFNIERHAGVRISDIFYGMGEQGFRSIEAAVLLETITAARGQNTVIVTGGGTPVFDGNFKTMQRTGFIVYLEATIPYLVKNLEITPQIHRPLIGEPTPEILEGLLQKRRTFYEQADMTVNAEELSKDTFAEIQKACIDRQLSWAQSRPWQQ
ncbi:MAG: shikimate kinase [Chitinophagaceae bacterium]